MYAYAAAGRRKSWCSGARHTKMEGFETDFNIKLPEQVSFILEKLMQHGYEAYAVGGCVRDSMLGKKPEDWDITTSAAPWQVKGLFAHTIDTGLQHGTVTVMCGRTGYEVTTYRIDGDYEDGRHPNEVTFTSSLLEDLKRRDFTVNAMAYNEKDGLVDAFDGAGDLKRGIIRCVGSPMDRFHEDALRVLRAVRFAAQLDFAVDEATQDAIKALAANLNKISAERIQTELVKLVTSEHPECMRMLYALGISKVILPEFDLMMETAQNHPHHCYSVGEHTIHSMCGIRPDKVLRLAMLFHDIAKPQCRTTDEEGLDHFHGHPVQGALTARQIFRRLKFDRDTMDAVCALVRWHDYNPPLSEENVRRAMIKVGAAQYPALFAVKRADILAQSGFKRQEKLQYVDEYEKMYAHILAQGDCLSLKQLAVSGRDLMELGIAQGKRIGEILNMLLEEVVADPDKNERDYLLMQVRHYLDSGTAHE